MDDLLKQLQTAAGGVRGAAPTDASAAGALGGLGGLLGGGGLGDLLGAAGGGQGGAAGLGGLLSLAPSVLAALPTLMPALLRMLSGSGQSGSGVHALVERMQANGMGNVAESWVGTGENEPISPDQAETALGPDNVQQLSTETGLPKEDVKQGAAALLPEIVNRLTPSGRIPDPAQIQQALGGLLAGGRLG